ncbi:MAG: GAF domain-containing protein [Acidimicrobiia bacterium]|nr:GAF domain-containing protein [Acidimicrobiia bacterium]
MRNLLGAFLAVEAELDLAAVLRRIAESARSLAGARYAALGVLDEKGQGLSQFISAGLDPEVERAIGHYPEGHGILGLLIVDPKALRLADLHDHPQSFGFPPNHPPMTSFLGVPIRVQDEIFGNLYLTEKIDGHEFSETDEALVSALAVAAGIAIDHARLHGRVRELALLEDRDRIARDLHDTVIQRLFALGLSLQGAARLAQRPEVSSRIDGAVDQLDSVIRQIRGTIFALEDRVTTGSVRRDVLRLTAEMAEVLGFQPAVTFDGPVETLMPDDARPELLATLREALTNVARHAKASRVDVGLAADRDIVLEVVDDGVGPPVQPRPGMGLVNMEDRARALGGDVIFEASTRRGARLVWRIPTGQGA